MASMLQYIRLVKCALRDQHGGVQFGGSKEDPLIRIAPGIYPCQIEGKTDYVQITDEDYIGCCNWTRPASNNKR